MKKVIWIIVIVLVLGGISIAGYLSERVVWNEEGVLGNSGGNILNGGDFCEYGGKIYFSNYMDEGTLYVMDEDLSNAKKIKNDIVSHINAAGNYIIYARRNNKRSNLNSIFIFDNMGVYRTTLHGKKTHQLFGDYTGMVLLYGNYVYYQHYTDKELLTLYQVKLDDKEEKQLSRESVMPTAIRDGVLYYNGIESDHYIHAIDLSTGSDRVIYEGNCGSCIESNGYLYFLDLDNGTGISRIRTDGSDYEQIVRDMCSTYNLSTDGSILYYQIDGSDDNRLCQMSLSSGNERVIQRGDYNSIHVTEHYVFFKDFHTKKYFYLDDAGNVNLFTPDVK